MNREHNIYFNDISGEELDAEEMNNFVKSESKRQYEECSGGSYNSLTSEQQQECILQQWDHQLSNRDWKCIN